MHRIAADFVQAGAVRVVDEVVIQGQGLIIGLAGRFGGTCAHRTEQWSCEKPLGRSDSPLDTFQVSRLDRAPHEREHAGSGRQSDDVAHSLAMDGKALWRFQWVRRAAR